MKVKIMIQSIAKVFTHLELFHILSRYDHKHVLLDFYVKDQHKVA